MLHSGKWTHSVFQICSGLMPVAVDRAQTVRGRLLEGRGEELSGLARALHQARLAEGRKVRALQALDAQGGNACRVISDTVVPHEREVLSSCAGMSSCTQLSKQPSLQN